MELSSRYTTIWAIKLVSNIFKRLKYNVFPDHTVIKLEIKNDKISRKEHLEIEQQTYKYPIVEQINSCGKL